MEVDGGVAVGDGDGLAVTGQTDRLVMMDSVIALGAHYEACS